jgi:hypothetical protein
MFVMTRPINLVCTEPRARRRRAVDLRSGPTRPRAAVHGARLALRPRACRI